MPFDSYGVLLANTKPERFVVAFLDLNFRRGEPFMRSSLPMPESELREQLAEMGCDEVKIEELLQRARNHFLRASTT